MVICLPVILKELLLVGPSKEEPRSLKQTKTCDINVLGSQNEDKLLTGCRWDEDICLTTQMLIFLQNNLLFFRSMCRASRLLAEELIILSREAGFGSLWRLEGQKNFFAVKERLFW